MKIKPQIKFHKSIPISIFYETQIGEIRKIIADYNYFIKFLKFLQSVFLLIKSSKIFNLKKLYLASVLSQK